MLLHLGIVALLFWLLHKSRVEYKAINRSKITLDLDQFQTLPPKPTTPRAHTKAQPPKIPRRRIPPPSPVPRPIPPNETPRTTPTEKPKPKSTDTQGFTQKKIARNDANLSQKRSETKIQKKKTRKKREKRKVERKKTPHPQRVAKEKPHKKVRKRHVKRQHTPRKKSWADTLRRPTLHRSGSRLVRSLYGSSYSRMSRLQRRFIDENLRRIIQISQRTLNYLGYPREAARFGEQGTNIVEFWLHPNGDISGLRLRRRLNSSSLNRQTIEVIKTAYMHYPRPRTKTKIIIYVRYQLR
ncbi:energy transducer TonB [Nitratifractor sp.]